MRETLAKTRPSWIAAGAVALLLVFSILLSGRPVLTYSVNQISELKTLPDDPRLDQMRYLTFEGWMPYPAERIYPNRGGPRQPLRVGWVYSEYGVFGMPFWAQAEEGLWLYVEQPTAVRFGYLSPGRIERLEELGSGPIPREAGFPWYRHIWGWLLPLLGLIWFLLWRREDRAREAAHWAEIEG